MPQKERENMSFSLKCNGCGQAWNFLSREGVANILVFHACPVAKHITDTERIDWLSKGYNEAGELGDGTGFAQTLGTPTYYAPSLRGAIDAAIRAERKSKN